MAQPAERPITTKRRSFDSLSYARSLEAGGFTRQQAEVLAEKQAELIDDRLATKDDLEALRVATKADLEALRLSLEAKITESRIGLEGKISDSKAEILKWMFGAIGLQTFVLLGALLGLGRWAAH